MKKIASLLMALMMVFSYTPVMAAEGDIVDVAVNNGSFTTLVAALTEAELVGALQGEGPFTVFAPTDAAFEKLLNGLGITAGDLLAHPDLSKVLLYHVVSGQVLSSDLSDGMMAPTLNGNNITIDLKDGVKINDANVEAADVSATNGVIHVIDTVLIPADFVLSQPEPAEVTAPAANPSIVEIALGNDDLSMLVALLQKAGLVEALMADGPFTVFAPTNAAFESLLSQLGISAEALMAQPDLSKVLLYHVISGQVLSTDLTEGLRAGTLNGNDVVASLSDGVKINTSNVIAADIMASNGVVHVIDQVLVPSDFTLSEVNQEATEVPKTGETNILGLSLLGVSFVIGSYAWARRSKKSKA
ncbi:fasciclin domain-containing protein [Petrocella sp. FN5]|uniref:fasciclin domain-containing protein n=1 Tax=Petrocella sp. FN5 TaxID=3032002 RepID=UPI0023D9C8BB|nr:fasciclin domain-containing protein [Petrocella sp. FN5]MDF1616105.1 fasciclin domain-containing protein [Petrocella sp. FN5]